MNDELQSLCKLPVHLEISSEDGMFKKGGEQHYFSVGLSSLYCVVNACRIREGVAGNLTSITDILDFGSGHGRVARWLRAAFPGANIWCADRDRSGLAFCEETLGCKPLATDDPQPNTMDVIWLGSVFTHLPASIAETLLTALIDALRPGGVLLFSTQGRFSRERMREYDWAQADKTPWVNYNMAKDAMDRICADYDRSGYGYEDYPNQPGYGIAIVDGAWYARVCNGKGMRQIFLLERGYDSHQDVLGFLKLPILDQNPSPWWRQAERFSTPNT
jgi:SAM-dependent methyltransferase